MAVDFTRVWNWYSRESVQKAILEVAKNREVVSVFKEGNFGVSQGETHSLSPRPDKPLKAFSEEPHPLGFDAAPQPPNQSRQCALETSHREDPLRPRGKTARVSR